MADKAWSENWKSLPGRPEAALQTAKQVLRSFVPLCLCGES